jgi:hypothetical protein
MTKIIAYPGPRGELTREYREWIESTGKYLVENPEEAGNIMYAEDALHIMDELMDNEDYDPEEIRPILEKIADIAHENRFILSRVPVSWEEQKTEGEIDNWVVEMNARNYLMELDEELDEELD